MSLNCREMLRLGAAGAGGLLMTVGGRVERRFPPVLVRQAAAAARPRRRRSPARRARRNQPGAVRARQGGARFARPQRSSRATSSAIVDFSPAFASAALPRRRICRRGHVESHAVAHGKGSDLGHSGYLENFSNQHGSEATSNGTYITSDTYEGKYGHSMRVKGLDWSNNNAEQRAIVIHNAWYAEPDVIAAARQARPQPGLLRFLRAEPVEGDGPAWRWPDDLRRQASLSSPERELRARKKAGLPIGKAGFFVARRAAGLSAPRPSSPRSPATAAGLPSRSSKAAMTLVSRL